MKPHRLYYLTELSLHDGSRTASRLGSGFAVGQRIRGWAADSRLGSLRYYLTECFHEAFHLWFGANRNA
jgi:hypothetical protein